MTDDIAISGLSNLVKQAFIAGIVKAGKNAAKSKGVKNLVNSLIFRISLFRISFESNNFFHTKNNIIIVSIIEEIV